MTHKVWYKIFEIDLGIEIYDIWPLDPYSGPQGGRQKKSCCTPQSRE